MLYHPPLYLRWQQVLSNEKKTPITPLIFFQAGTVTNPTIWLVNKLSTGWEVRIAKNCDLGLENAALGLQSRAAFSRPRSQCFSIRTSQPVNNIYLFFLYRLVATDADFIPYHVTINKPAQSASWNKLSLINVYMSLYPVYHCLFILIVCPHLPCDCPSHYILWQASYSLDWMSFCLFVQNLLTWDFFHIFRRLFYYQGSLGQARHCQSFIKQIIIGVEVSLF